MYLTNGFDDKIIANTENRTFHRPVKKTKIALKESFNGSPLFTGKVAIKHRKVGELNYPMGGVYNKFKEDGLVLDKKRRVDVVAVDSYLRLSLMPSSMESGPGLLLNLTRSVYRTVWQ